MINKTVLRRISRFRDLLELAKTELFESENYLYIEDDTMILRCVVDDEDVRYRYNFNDGDFSEYKQMIDDDFLI